MFCFDKFKKCPTNESSWSFERQLWRDKGKSILNSFKLLVIGQSKICDQSDQKKSSNVYKSCLKMIAQEKWKILTPLQKFPKNMRYFDKLIAAKGFKKLPKVQ